MSVLTLTSASAAPGVTTTALGFALEWPRDALLADCNRDPDHTVLAGYLAGLDPGGRGLPSLIHAHREGKALETELPPSTIPLASGVQPQRQFLPGFSRPAGADLFGPVWPGLMNAFQSLSRTGTDVIIDAGRITRAGVVSGVVRSSDAVLVCTGSSLRALAGLRMYLPQLAHDAGEVGTRLGLVLIGEGRPYTAGEISTQFGTPVVATVAHDPSAAAVLTEGTPAPRKFASSPYRRSLVAAASRIAADLDAYLRPIRGGTT